MMHGIMFSVHVAQLNSMATVHTDLEALHTTMLRNSLQSQLYRT